MVDAASLDTGWDFWILALLVALLLPASMPVKADPEPPRGKMVHAARLATEGPR